MCCSLEGFPKVLIVSHEVINKNTSVGKTLFQYFEKWPQGKLSQLYFHSEIPTTTICKQYYRITDFDIIKSLFPFKLEGREIKPCEIDEERKNARTDEGISKKIYRLGQKKNSLMFPLRDLLWGLNKWKTKELKDWVGKNKPDVIFFLTSDYQFPYAVLTYILKHFGIPVVVCVFDDYYYGTIMKKNIVSNIYVNNLRKKIRKTLNSSKFILYNQPKMEALYHKNFLVPSDILYVSASQSYSVEKDNQSIIISYFGSLGLGRADTILSIGAVIEEVLPDINIRIDVYSSESDNYIINKLRKNKRIHFYGSISSEEVNKKIDDSNVLLLPESFDTRYKGRIEFALSTKVPEYLGSNRCILAYGPLYAGTMEYLYKNNVGVVCISKEELKVALKNVIIDELARHVETVVLMSRKDK